MRIGHRIREVRTARKIKQKKLAADIGVTQPQLSDWERGRFEPDRDNLLAVARALDLPVEYFHGTRLTTADTPEGVTYPPSPQEGGADVRPKPDQADDARDLRAVLATVRAHLQSAVATTGDLVALIDGAIGRDEGATVGRHQSPARKAARRPARPAAR